MASQEAWIALGTLILVTTLGIFDHELWTPDEPRDAEISREMLLQGFGATPTLNGVPFLEKPPLYYWSVALAYRVLGVHAWVSRVPSLFFGWGALAFTGLLARKIAGPGTGLRSALVLSTLGVFLQVTHKCLVDNALVCTTTGAFYFLYDAFTRTQGKLTAYLAAYAFGLLSFLSKGLIGPGILGFSFLAFLLLSREPREILRAQPWWGIGLLAAGAGLWLGCLSAESRRSFLWTHHLGRFTGVDWSGGHVQPPYYYPLALLYSLAPWTLVVPAALVGLWKKDAEPGPRRFLLTWIGAGLVLLSLAETKRETYLLPLLPAVAILVAGWLGGLGQAPRWARASAVIMAGVVALGLAGVFGAGIYFGNWVGFSLAGFLAISAGFALRKASWPIVLPAGTAALAASAFLVLVPVVDRAKSLAPFCRELPPVDPVPAFHPDEMTLAMIPFYTGRRVRPVESSEEAQALSRSRPAYIVVVEKRAGESRTDRLLPGYPTVLLDRELLGKRRLLLLSSEPR